MINDITDKLLLAASYSSNWSFGTVRKVLNQITTLSIDYIIDWDEMSGESWAVVFENNTSVAIVSTVVPLIICKTYIIRQMLCIGDNVVVIGVDDFEDKSVSLDNGMIAQIFGIDNIDIDLSDESFSINDLYYSVV